MEGSVEGFEDGSDIAICFSEMSGEKDYDEEELKIVASVMSPRVSSLLESNEAALDHLLAKNYETWLEEEKKFGAKLTAETCSDEEDGIEDELNRLPDAEQVLRDELEMSDMGFGFLSYFDVQRSGEESIEEVQASFGDHARIDNYDEQSVGGYDDSGDSVHVIDAVSEEQMFSVEKNDMEAGLYPETHLQQQQQMQGSEVLEDDISTSNNDTTMNRSEESSASRMRSYSLYDHATFIGLHFDDTDLGYPTCPLLTKDDAVYFCKVPDYSDTTTQDCEFGDNVERKSRIEREATIELDKCMREYVKPMSSSALCRIYAGLEEGAKYAASKNRKGKGKKNDVVEDDQDGVGISIKDSDGSGVESKQEIIPVRTVAIQIRPDVLVGAVMDATYASIMSLNGEVTKRQGGHLRALIPGRWVKESDYMPFRNVSTKEQLSNVFGSPASVPVSKGDFMNGMIFFPPLVIDAQLCTKKKSIYAERILLIRTYKISEGQILDDDAAVCPRSPPHAAMKNRKGIDTDFSKDLIRPNNILRESSSLFQRMKTVATVGGKIGFDMGELLEDESTIEETSAHNHEKDVSSFRKLLTSPIKFFSPTKKQQTPKRNVRKNKHMALNVRFETEERPLMGLGAAQKLASRKLLSAFIETPSVMDKDASIDPIAALSEVDWPFIQSAWLFLSDCLNELDNRNLSFSSLISSAFGAFPSLPTLDVHYCSQIKEICKENMVASLLKSARELETYAEEAEYATAKLMQVLEPMLLSYDEELPQIPEKVPLSEYPLDFVSPEVSSPPWGQKVVEALNLITTKSPATHEFVVDNNRITLPEEKVRNDDCKSEFQRARDSVNMVLNAFQKQYDDELSIRLERKNCQVMDRLAKMQAFRREVLMTVRGSYGINILATKAADKFHSYAKELCTKDSIDGNELDPLSNTLPASDQVPLLTCRVIYGRSTGICYVTYYELLLVMHSIPLVGGSHVNLVRLGDIDVEIKSGKKSRLNPVPSIIVVKRKHDAQELFSFRPSAGAHLFKDFVDIVKVVSQESPEAITFSSENRLLSMVNERRSAQNATLGET